MPTYQPKPLFWLVGITYITVNYLMCRGMPILKGEVLGTKFTTAVISDSDDRVHFVPIKHTIGDYFLVQIDEKYFAFTLKGKRILTHRSKTGIGKSFQMIQYDTSNSHCLKPTTKELEVMLSENSLGKLDRQKFEILSILARREKKNFGKWSVGKRDFETEKEAKDYLENLDDKTIPGKDENDKDVKIILEVKHNIHSMEELALVFEKEKGEFPAKVKEIKAYLDSLDINHIVTPIRNVTDFIEHDLITEDSGFLGEGMARVQRLDGTLREVTNVPVKPKGNMMKYLVVALVIGIGVAGVYALSESGALDGVTDFMDNLSTIQEGFKGLPSPTQGIQRSSSGGIDYSDAAIMAKYPDCNSLESDINTGLVDYNKLSSQMQGFIDSCP